MGLLRAGGPDSTTANLLTVCLDEFGISAPDAYKRIRDAKASHAKGIDLVDRSEEMASVLAKFEAVYAGASEDRDWSAASKALAGICGMLGLKP